MAYCAAVGDILDVSALVENTGQDSGNQDIYFYRDDAQFGLVGGVQLNEDESQTVSSTLDTSSLSPGTYVIKVQSADNSDVFEFDLVDPTNTAFYLVDIASTNEPVDPGETFEITATIRNVGDQDGTQDIVFSTNGTTRDTISGKQITAGNQDTVTLSWSVTQSDVGDYTANVSTADCEDTQDIVIGASAFFDVTITSTNSPVNEGETLEVTAELSNTGNDTDTQDITLDVGGTQRDSFLGYFLEPGQTETETFRWFTEDGDAGDYTATVESQDDTATASVSVDAAGLAGEVAFVAEDESGIHRIDTADGSQVLKAQPRSGTVFWSMLRTNPDGTAVYAYNNSDDELLKLDHSDLSNVLWSVNTGPQVNEIAFTDSTFYIAQENEIQERNRSDGSLVQSNTLTLASEFPIEPRLSNTGGALYFVTDDPNNFTNSLINVSPTDLTLNWESQVYQDGSGVNLALDEGRDAAYVLTEESLKRLDLLNQGDSVWSTSASTNADDIEYFSDFDEIIIGAASTYIRRRDPSNGSTISETTNSYSQSEFEYQSSKDVIYTAGFNLTEIPRTDLNNFNYQTSPWSEFSSEIELGNTL